MKMFRDGDMFCLVQDDFVNLQESPALFVTPKEFRAFLDEMANPAPHEPFKPDTTEHKS